MPFQHLRPGAKLYILAKTGKPQLDVADVTNISAPYPQYPNGTNYAIQPTLVVDIDIRKKTGETASYKLLPANADVMEYSNRGEFITGSRDAINAEINAMIQRSNDIINSVEMHRDTVNICNGLISFLNPEIAERERLNNENQELRNELHEMHEMLSRLCAGAVAEKTKTK